MPTDGQINLKPLLYGLLNVFSASAVVFANKAVFSKYGFHFTYTLTLIHTLVTLVGMWVMSSAMGLFTVKPLPLVKVAPLAAAFVAYIVFCNLNLQLNTVGFYQITKIAVAPAVLVIEFLLFRKTAALRVMAAIALVCVGVGLSTLTDVKMGTSSRGLAVGAAAVAATALYQIWAGSKQKELHASSMQLLQQYCPAAAAMLAGLVLTAEPLGLRASQRDADTLLGYQMTPAAGVAIALSAVLGLLVSLSTFLVIGATSSLSYNVIGHVKTVIILTGGCLLFGEEMPWRRLAGICVAMVGIVWYSVLKLQESAAAAERLLPSTANGVRQPTAPVPIWRQGLENWDSGGKTV